MCGQGKRKERRGGGLDHVHLDLDVLVLELGLQVGQLLGVRRTRGEGGGENQRKRRVRER